MIIKNIVVLFFFCGLVSCSSVQEESKEEATHRTFEGSSSAVVR